jgi:urease accessory protein
VILRARGRGWIEALLAGFVAIARSGREAQAHLVTTGLGPVYDGGAHFVLTPEDLISVIGIAVLAGLRGPAHGRWTLIALPVFWLLGGLAGQTIGRPAPDVMTAASFLVIGGLVAADASLSPGAVAGIAALVAAGHGYADGSGMEAGRAGILMLIGIVVAVFTTFALAIAFVLPVQSRLVRTAMRVSGSWTAAAGLLLLGWSLRSGLLFPR